MLERRRGEPGYSLVGLLVIVLVLGLLTATAIIGVSALTDDNGAISAISSTTVGSPPAPRGGSGVGSVGIAGSKSAAVNACRATADGASTASTVYFANSGGTYPSKWADLTASTPPLIELTTGVVIAPGNPTELEGSGWKLRMTGGGTVAPTFTCS